MYKVGDFQSTQIFHVEYNFTYKETLIYIATQNMSPQECL